jgi:hypothetical protein
MATTRFEPGTLVAARAYVARRQPDVEGLTGTIERVVTCAGSTRDGYAGGRDMDVVVNWPGIGARLYAPSNLRVVKMNVDLLAAVKAYATEHYDENGWDAVVEAYDDTQLTEAIGRATTPAGAIRNVKEHVAPWNERRREVQAEVF